jgi:ATP-dependent Clp protease ATP-binding subunit ClpC
MYERFTDRARKVMQLAGHEAQRFNHEYVGTEHILLGLVMEGSGVAANVLKNVNLDLRKIRREVEKLVQCGPDMVVCSRLPQTPRVKVALGYAIEEARNLNHNYVGTEHLLLGLLREQEGVAAQVLMNLGLKLEGVREEVLNLLGHNMAAMLPPRPKRRVGRGDPAPGLGRRVRRRRAVLLFLGGLLAPLAGALVGDGLGLTADPSTGPFLAGFAYLTAVGIGCGLSGDRRSRCSCC